MKQILPVILLIALLAVLYYGALPPAQIVAGQTAAKITYAGSDKIIATDLQFASGYVGPGRGDPYLLLDTWKINKNLASTWNAQETGNIYYAYLKEESIGSYSGYLQFTGDCVPATQYPITNMALYRQGTEGYDRTFMFTAHIPPEDYTGDCRAAVTYYIELYPVGTTTTTIYGSTTTTTTPTTTTLCTDCGDLTWLQKIQAWFGSLVAKIRLWLYN